MIIRILYSFSLSLLVCFQSSANPLEGLLSQDNLENVRIPDGVELIPGEDGNSMSLKFPASEKRLSVMIPLPGGPQDWNDIGTLSFHSESNSTIRYFVGVHNSAKERFGYNVYPYLNVPARVAIAGSYWKGEYMNSTQFKAHWLANWGNHIDLNSIETIEISMQANQPVTLKLGHFTLHEDEIEDAILAEGPYVDEFGQWIGLDWPGKFYSLEELQAAWAREEAQLAEAQEFGFSRYGGWKERRVKGTGYFRVEEIDGRWWFVDPQGYLFFSTGMDCVRHRSPTQVEGREKLFEALPPLTGSESDFYQANAELRYSEEGYFETFMFNQNQHLRHWGFTENWKKTQNQRLRSWGFNTVGNWSNRSLWWDPELPFVMNLSFNTSGKNWHRFPDVYSEEFVRQVEGDAQRQCARYREEPFLIGYFTGNEERWPNRHFIELILKDPEPTATQAYVVNFLKQQGDTPESREKLTEDLARKYFKTLSDAIRKADPNHLILGIRWAGGHAPDAVIKANDVFDVFSLNLYRFRPEPEQIEHLHNLTGLPIIIGEFHFGTVGRGYAPSLVKVKDQRQRKVAYQYYVEQAAYMPMIVGTHYFQFLDQPVTGRYDGENYLFGFVNQQDVPYPGMVEAARATHRRVHSIHAGETRPTETRAIVK